MSEAEKPAQAIVAISPDRIPPLTSEQMDRIIETQREVVQNQHQLRLRDKDTELQAQKAAQLIGGLVAASIVALVFAALFKGQIALVKELGVPLVTGVLGYLAGFARGKSAGR